MRGLFAGFIVVARDLTNCSTTLPPTIHPPSVLFWKFYILRPRRSFAEEGYQEEGYTVKNVNQWSPSSGGNPGCHWINSSWPGIFMKFRDSLNLPLLNWEKTHPRQKCSLSVSVNLPKAEYIPDQLVPSHPKEGAWGGAEKVLSRC